MTNTFMNLPNVCDFWGMTLEPGSRDVCAHHKNKRKIIYLCCCLVVSHKLLAATSWPFIIIVISPSGWWDTKRLLRIFVWLIDWLLNDLLTPLIGFLFNGFFSFFQKGWYLTLLKVEVYLLLNFTTMGFDKTLTPSWVPL